MLEKIFKISELRFSKNIHVFGTEMELHLGLLHLRRIQCVSGPTVD